MATSLGRKPEQDRLLRKFAPISNADKVNELATCLVSLLFGSAATQDPATGGKRLVYVDVEERVVNVARVLANRP